MIFLKWLHQDEELIKIFKKEIKFKKYFKNC